MSYESAYAALDSRNRDERLAALAELAASGATEDRICVGDVNNHIHTRYSFSPYYPAKAVWLAYKAGLATAGIMDHDSISGAEEFLRAGEIIGLPVTSGAELRVSFADTPFGDRRINNPDQSGNVYMALHAIPEKGRAAVREFFRGVAAARGNRNRRMTANINKVAAPLGVVLNYDADVLQLSEAHDGGSVTERHLLFAFALKLIERFGSGEKLITALEEGLCLRISAKNREWLSDTSNPGYAYDVLGVLKSDLVSEIYIDADKAESPDVRDVLSLAARAGAVSAYAYLGDVGSSVTGDKRAQKFEDDYLDELVPYLAKLGFNAVTYMPSRNTAEQLARISALCRENGLFQISGEDINSPRQKFVCEAARDARFDNLKTAAWALIGSERLASKDLRASMFSDSAKADEPDTDTRAEYYANAAKNSK